MPRLSRFLTGSTACSAATIVLASTASATTTTGTLIEPHDNKYGSNNDYGVRSDDLGSLTIRGTNGERGFTVVRSTADGSRVTAHPDIFRGWQWGVGTNGPRPVTVSDAGLPRAGISVGRPGPAGHQFHGKYLTLLAVIARSPGGEQAREAAIGALPGLRGPSQLTVRSAETFLDGEDPPALRWRAESGRS